MYKIELSAKELAKLDKKRKKEKNKMISDRLRCIYLAAKGKKNKEIQDVLAVNKNSVTNWIKIYREKGLEELCRPADYNRRAAKIDDYVEKIKQDVKDNTISTLSELQDWIRTNYALAIELSWLYRCCKKNSICLARKPV